MAYLQTPPEAGPSIVQVTTGLQNWKCAGRRLVEIGGRLPTATQLHQSFIKILSKHLAANKKVNFVFQQQSSTISMMMNPSPTAIVELFSFVEVTLILACWLSQNNQNKVITILSFAQYFCWNKSSPIRTSHNNAFVARVFYPLILQFAFSRSF